MWLFSTCYVVDSVWQLLCILGHVTLHQGISPPFKGMLAQVNPQTIIANTSSHIPFYTVLSYIIDIWNIFKNLYLNLAIVLYCIKMYRDYKVFFFPFFDDANMFQKACIQCSGCSIYISHAWAPTFSCLIFLCIIHYIGNSILMYIHTHQSFFFFEISFVLGYYLSSCPLQL